jgi:predicted membrane-bound spermidine synthase
MLVQLAVLREIRHTLSTLFTLTPFLFSAVIFFMGIGSWAARRVSADSRAVLRWGLAALPLLLLPLFALTIALSQASMDHTADLFGQVAAVDGARTPPNYIATVSQAFIVVAIFGYGPVFVLQGLIFGLYFREGRDEGTLSTLYAFDLAASGAAALLGGALASYLTPIGSVGLASAVLLITLWIVRRYLELPRGPCLAVTLVALAMIAGESATGWIGRLEAPSWLPGRIVFSTWTPYRRIDVTERGDIITVHTDGLPVQFYDRNERVHEADPRSIQVLLAERDESVRRVLLIGSGSGADVKMLRDRLRRPLDITAVEMEAGYVRAARTLPWLWSAYRTAHIVVEEGRHFLERAGGTFDMVIYAYIDPQSGVSKLGVPDANFLYTDRGLRRAYARLRPGGYFVLNRVYLAEQTDRFFAQLCATLAAAGIKREEVSLFRSTDSLPLGSFGRLGTATVLARKDGPPPAMTHAVLTPVAWIEGGRPTTDFYPFSMVTDAWFGTLWDYVTQHATLGLALALVAVLLLARLVTSLPHAHFFALGFASFLVESLVLLQSFLLFGNPSLSAALAVGFFLLWAGLGSLRSERLAAWGPLYALVPAAVLLYALTAPLLLAATMGAAVGVRTLLFGLHLSIVALPVGALFPISLRAFSDQPVTSMLLIDLVGCALAPIAFWLMMSMQGVPLVALVGVVGYAAVSGVLARRR